MFEVILATQNKNYSTKDDDNEKENSNSNAWKENINYDRINISCYQNIYPSSIQCLL